MTRLPGRKPKHSSPAEKTGWPSWIQFEPSGSTKSYLSVPLLRHFQEQRNSLLTLKTVRDQSVVRVVGLQNERLQDGLFVVQLGPVLLNDA